MRNPIAWRFRAAFFGTIFAISGCGHVQGGSPAPANDGGVEGSLSSEGSVSSEAAAPSDASVVATPPKVMKTSDPATSVPFVDACTRTDGFVTVLSRAGMGATPIVADASYVYYDEYACGPGSGKGCLPVGGAIRRVPRCGGTPEILDPGPELVAQLLDGGSVVYAIRANGMFPSPDYGPYGVVRIDKTTGAIQELPVPELGLPQSGYRYAASSDRLVYFDSEIRTFRVDSDAPDSASRKTQSGVYLLTATQSMLYWWDGSAIVYRAPLNDPNAPAEQFPLASVSTIVPVPASDRVYVYANPSNAGELYVLDSTGGLTDLGSFPNTPFTSDGTALYYPETTPGTDRVTPGSSTSAERVLRYYGASSSNGYGSVAVNGGSLFWRDSYVFTRPATPEPLPEPISSADAPAWLRHANVTSYSDIAALPQGGFVLAGEDSTGTDAGGLPGGPTLDESFVSIFSTPDSVAKKVTTLHTGLGVDSAGNILVVNSPTAWLRLDSSGNQLQTGVLSARTVAGVGPSGVFATAELAQDGSSDALVSLYAVDGTVSWAAPLVGAMSAGFHSVAVTSDDRVLVAGASLTSFDSTGVIQWQHALQGFGEIALAAAPNGDAVLASSANVYFDIGRGLEAVQMPGRPNVVLARFDPGGNVLWVRSFEASSQVALALDAAGLPVLAVSLDLSGFANLGTAVPGGLAGESFVARFDATGNPTSVKRWSEISAYNYPALLSGVSVDTSGNALVPSSMGSVAAFTP